MSQNLFRQLAALLPDAPVYVGKVLELHDDDTSTVELPIALTTVSVGGGLARGALIRPRGRTVPVGGWAFVRRGVIETRAPDPAPEAISVGAPVAPGPDTWLLDTFTGAAGPLEEHTSDSGHAWESGWELDGAGNIEGGSGLARSLWTVPPSVAFFAEIEASTTDRCELVLFDPTQPSQTDLYLSVRASGGTYRVEGFGYDGSSFEFFNEVDTGVAVGTTFTARIELAEGHASVVFKFNGTTLDTLTWPGAIEIDRVCINRSATIATRIETGPI
jgi:hypothetical protein